MNTKLAERKGISVLQGFVEHRDIEPIKRAYLEGVHPNDCSILGRSPLTAAVVNGTIDIVKLLLDMGADTEQPAQVRVMDEQLLANSEALEQKIRTGSWLLPIQWAATMGNLEAAELLYETGADIDAQAGSLTALQLAVKFQHAHVAAFLLDHGAQLNAVLDSTSYSTLGLAIETGNLSLAQILLQRGADPNLANGHRRDGRAWASTTFEMFPLELACYDGHAEIARLLLRSGADPNKGYPLLALAESFRMKNQSQVLEVLKTMADYGVDVNRRHIRNDMSLQAFIRRGNYQCC